MIGKPACRAIAKSDGTSDLHPIVRVAEQRSNGDATTHRGFGGVICARAPRALRNIAREARNVPQEDRRPSGRTVSLVLPSKWFDFRRASFDPRRSASHIGALDVSMRRGVDLSAGLREFSSPIPRFAAPGERFQSCPGGRMLLFPHFRRVPRDQDARMDHAS
jgi:hypothetical protein